MRYIHHLYCKGYLSRYIFNPHLLEGGSCHINKIVEFITFLFFLKVCDDSHSELIPCLDRHLIYQLRLKLDLSLMEHYERHCPPPERRFNCLIPPPAGYKVKSTLRVDVICNFNISLSIHLYCVCQCQTILVPLVLQIPIKWPQSRDEVWKANIPHTHLAHEKSDQNWMIVKGEKIVFPGGGTHFHHGADKYIASIAKVRLTGICIIFYNCSIIGLYACYAVCLHLINRNVIYKLTSFPVPCSTVFIVWCIFIIKIHFTDLTVSLY